jgi:hypothetical protein
VFYGQFTACNINAVTKSGSNEWHGSAFYDYTNDSMTGDKLEGQPIDTGDFTIKRYGATLGGPILKDKLFFFVAYEYLKGANLFDRVPTGADTSGRVIKGVSQEQLDEIAQIAAWFVIKNLCNLINNEWCVLREASFPRAQALVDMKISEDGTQYVYEQFVEPSGQGRVSDPSLWEFRIGLTYRF